MTEDFAGWLRYVFDHPVAAPGQEAWYWGDEAEAQHERWASDAAVNVGMLTRLLRESDSLDPFSRDQVAQGLWFLLGWSPIEVHRDIYAPEVELSARVSCIRATPTFFEAYVARHCLQEGPGSGADDEDDLAGACFMWWDLWLHGLDHVRADEGHVLVDATLEALSAIAAIPSVACIESALHGLNHVHEKAPEATEAVIDSLLGKSGGWAAKLVEYAHEARRGAGQ